MELIEFIMKFTHLQLKEILFGCLLGDANLQTFTGGKSWRARFIQPEQHKLYLFHLFEIFSHFVNTPPKSIIDNSGNIRWYFNTTVQLDLLEFAQYFYSKKKKVLPSKDILFKYLSPLAISYWFMDDGSLKSNCLAYYLCTDCFSLLELKILAEVFLEKYNIIVNFHKKGMVYHIYISKSEYLKFRNLIEPNIHYSMNYKLPKI